MEDLKEFGSEQCVCPYYLSRGLQKEADLVLSPYNYLIQPSIRKLLKIDLDNQVVVIDEAHNIENSARESLNFNASLEDLERITIELREKLIKYGQKFVEKAELLQILVNTLQTMIENLAVTGFRTDRYGNKYKSWNGSGICDAFKEYQITPQIIGEARKNYEWIQLKVGTKVKNDNSQDEEIVKASKPIPEFTALASSIFERFFNCTQFLFKHSSQFAMYLTQSIPTFTNRYNRNSYNRKRKSKFIDDNQQLLNNTVKNELSIWCNSSYLAFQDGFKNVRSVILTSGTLSPIFSFESELKTEFPIKLEAGHVIDIPRQARIGTISRGPNNVEYKLVYNNTKKLEVQDSIGKLILNYAKVIPDGILVFFPSYTLMNKFKSRWELTNLWYQLAEIKDLFVEPQGKSKKFKSTMNKYYRAIKQNKKKSSTKTGAIFFVACRGKVSEGMDFADEKARCTIVLGIPYPNLSNLQILEKKGYNNKFSRKNGLLNGSKWYDLQAYRALNQAIGRCLRHRYDYGSIILVDSRYALKNVKLNLTKWIRNSIVDYRHWEQSVLDLKNFFENIKQNPIVPGESDNIPKSSQIYTSSFNLNLEKSNQKSSFTTNNQLNKASNNSQMINNNNNNNFISNNSLTSQPNLIQNSYQNKNNFSNSFNQNYYNNNNNSFNHHQNQNQNQNQSQNWFQQQQQQQQKFQPNLNQNQYKPFNQFPINNNKFKQNNFYTQQQQQQQYPQQQFQNRRFPQLQPQQQQQQQQQFQKQLINLDPKKNQINDRIIMAKKILKTQNTQNGVDLNKFSISPIPPNKKSPEKHIFSKKQLINTYYIITKKNKKKIKNENTTRICCVDCGETLYNWKNNFDNISLIPKELNCNFRSKFTSFLVLENQFQKNQFKGIIDKTKRFDKFTNLNYFEVYCSFCGHMMGILTLNFNFLCIFENTMKGDFRHPSIKKSPLLTKTEDKDSLNQESNFFKMFSNNNTKNSIK
ncbi:fanconi anemia group j protein [Anaeramoeba flamelloides]|uniref:Fanconi anemia group j protein n=1 Tax=Anaeramoeba flamelloides TaxID=1746091 RepID=A0ABQ8YMC9_9EUKA|nr:fanconi anemia group j protein [Anaeramoeba flamelloides]